MAFLQVNFFSQALNVASNIFVILPEPDMGIGVTAKGDTEQKPKVLYLLHGYSDDHTIWLRRTSVERYAAERNLAVIMPAVNHSFYTNEKQGERYMDYVAEELPRTVHTFFRLSEDPKDTFVAGLSMGGYGAMKLALTHPERYAAAGSFSGALDISGVALRNIGNMRRIFGDPKKVPGSEHDLFALLKKNADAPQKPKLYVSCGDKDFLLNDHNTFCPAAKAAGWEIYRKDVPGFGHEWAFWDQEIAAFMDWAGI